MYSTMGLWLGRGIEGEREEKKRRESWEKLDG
jgi:hypothetical protein